MGSWQVGSASLRCRALAVLCLATMALLAAACGAQQKKEDAERIVSAVERLTQASTAKAELRQSITLERLRDEIRLPGIKEGFTSPAVVAPLDIEFRTRRVMATVPGATPDQAAVPVQVFSDTRVFQRQASDAAPGGGREWTTLDLRTLYDDREGDIGGHAGSNLINPSYVVDLLAGALTGSIKEVGKVDVRGTPTTHYEFNLAPETAFEDAPDRRREAVEAGLLLMGAIDDVLPAEVWLDDEGLPRRIAVKIRQARDRRTVIRLNVELDLFDFGTPIDIPLPIRRTVASVSAINALGRSTAGALLPGNVAGPGGLPISMPGVGAPDGSGAAPTEGAPPAEGAPAAPTAPAAPQEAQP